VLRISAKTGLGVQRILPALRAAIDAYHRRIPTGQLNETMREIQSAQPAAGARILYAVQGAVDPPTITLFTTGRMHATYLRYIERSLRERYGLVRMVVGKINLLTKLYRSDRTMVQEISRVRTLLLRPTEEFENIFAQVDAMTGEILPVLRKFDAQVQFIRQNRDDLHTRLMIWDPIFAIWERTEAVRGAEAEAAIKELYRFVARYFPQRQDWRAAR